MSAAEGTVEESGRQRDEIFIRGLSFSTRELALARFIETVAPVEDVHILMAYNRSKGMALVTLKDPNQVDEVVEKLNGKTLDGRFLDVSRAKPFSELPPRHFSQYPPRRFVAYPPRRPFNHYYPPPPRRPFYPRSQPVAKPAPEQPSQSFRHIKRDPNPDRTKSEFTVAVLNLPFVAKEEDMNDIFEDFTVVSCKVSRHPNGQSKGVAFVTFPTHEDQQHAIQATNLNIVEGRKIRVVEAFLLPEDLEEESKSIAEFKAK